MKIEVQKLGVIDSASLEIGDLTIVCGKNNIGKTYLTYSLYSFLHTIQERMLLPISDKTFNDCYKNSETVLDAEIFFSKYNEILKEVLPSFSKSIPFFLALNSKNISPNLNFSFELNNEDFNYFIKTKLGIKVQVTENCSIHLEKIENTSKITITLINSKLRLPRRESLKKAFIFACSVCINQLFIDVFSLTSERTGVSIFGEDFRRIRSITETLAFSKKIKVQKTDELERKALPYALPVMKEITFFSGIKQINKRQSFITKEHPEIIQVFNSISGGTYSVDEQLGIVYTPDNTTVALQLSECSSSVKALVELYFYLTCCAQKHQMLMIDEPELTLHPANQRKLARLLAHLVNLGIKVFITTHSDYIIREFNTLIQLKTEDDFIKKLKEMEGYSDSELLDATKVKAYVAKRESDGVHLDPAPISSENGMTIDTLDEVIDKMREIHDAIVWGE